jgi:hypothetical protein
MPNNTKDPAIADASTPTSTTVDTSQTRSSADTAISPLAEALAGLYQPVILATIERTVQRFDTIPEARWSIINEETDICVHEIEAKPQNKEPKTEDEVKFWKSTIRYHLLSVLKINANAGEDITIVAREETLKCVKDLRVFSVMYRQDDREEKALTDATCE